MSEVAGVDQRDSQPSSRAVVGDPAADDACADHQQVEMTLRQLLESSRAVHSGNHSGPPVKLTGSGDRHHGCAVPALGHCGWKTARATSTKSIRARFHPAAAGHGGHGSIDREQLTLRAGKEGLGIRTSAVLDSSGVYPGSSPCGSF